MSNAHERHAEHGVAPDLKADAETLDNADCGR
jgi:hypothetical protein